MTKARNIFAAAMTAAALALGNGAATAAQSTTWDFDVYLDDREIGYHRFDVTWDAGRTEITSEARFAVKILFLNAYSYNHDNTETWSGNCLVSIDARTDDNGKLSAVSGSAQDGAFSVSTGEESSTLPGCVNSFAYWNPAFLKADKLLNAQTGRHTPAEVTDSSDDVVTIGGEDIPARRVTLAAGERPIKLWYRAEDGAWLQLQTTAPKGRELRYTLAAAPDRNALPARRLADALDAVR